MPTLPIPVDGAVMIWTEATNGVTAATGVVLDGLNVSAPVQETLLETPSVSGVYLVSACIRLITAATGGAAPTSTVGPVLLNYTCADSLQAVTDVLGTVNQAGLNEIANTGNALNNSLCGSAVICVKNGNPLDVSIGYISSGSGSGGKVDVTASGGAITGFLVWIPVGSGYVVGDVLQVSGGNDDATLTITSVNGSGQPTGAAITSPGTGYSNFTTYNLVEAPTMTSMVYSYHIKAVFLGAA